MTDILVDRKGGGIVWVTLNRPDARNALSLAVNRRLIELATELDADNSVRAIVLTGAGEQAFCAGADLKERRGVPASECGPYIDAISGAITAWSKVRRPTIAAMNGSAYGGGLDLALACDFRIIDSRAEVGLTEVRLGIMPGAGGTQRLSRLIGPSRAKELILLGRRISAARAGVLGVVNEVAPVGALSSVVDTWLADLAAAAPLSVVQAKAAIDRGFDVPMIDALHIERECYDVTLFSDDRNEGLAAFAEKRTPNYRGH